MKELCAGACLTIVIMSSLFSHAADANADAKFKAIYEKEWAWRQSQRGEEEDDSAGAYRKVNAELPKVDAATQEAKLNYWADVLQQLDAISPSNLSPAEQVNYAVYRAQIQDAVNSQKFRDYEMPFNSDSAFWSGITYTPRQTFHTLQDYNNYISQLNDIPRFFDEETVNMRAGLKRGFTPPHVTLIGRDSSIASIANAKTPEDTIFYEPFKKMPANIPAVEQEKLRAEAAKVIRDKVMPSYAALLKFVRDEYIPAARKTLAAEELPDGKAYYQSQILEYTTTDLTPAEIHQIGLDQMAMIHAEMLATMKEAGFNGEFPAFLHFLRTDPQFYAKTPQELLMQAAWISKEFDGKASQYFGYLPRERFAIKPVPADQAPFYTSARGGPGVYLVNTYDLPSRPLYSLPALTLHESAPGHAFQIPIAMEHKNLPRFRRGYISAYGEGWALYSERLGTEMGMYHTPYEKFGMLSYQAWRAARLVVDTGIHSQGWTRAQAQQYMRDNTALSDHEIETEVDRYISWPGQALSYYLGERAILEGRAEAQKALGERFNLRAFHDAVLELGSVPLPVLKARIARFIAEGGKGPYPDME